MFPRQMFVIPTFGSSVNLIFVLFQLHRNRRVKVDIISYHGWRSNSSFPCIKYSHLLPSTLAKCVFFYYCLVTMVTIETVGLKLRWSLILKITFPLLLWALCPKTQIGKIIRGEEFNQMQRIDWSNASWTVKCYY